MFVQHPIILRFKKDQDPELETPCDILGINDLIILKHGMWNRYVHQSLTGFGV